MKRISSVEIRIYSEYGEMWTRNTPNMDTSHAVNDILVLLSQ